jgi:hypothetical protein
MSAPDASFIVEDPEPLNSDSFPYAVQPFPGKDLAVNGIFRVLAARPASAREQEAEAHRYEN